VILSVSFVGMLTCKSFMSKMIIPRNMLYTLILLSVTYFRYTTHSICASSNSEGSKKLHEDDRLLPKHVGTSILNKGVVQMSA
jgi:hypothetical protein